MKFFVSSEIQVKKKNLLSLVSQHPLLHDKHHNNVSEEKDRGKEDVEGGLSFFKRVKLLLESNQGFTCD